MKNGQNMKLGCFCPPPGHHLAAWKMKNVDPMACMNFDFYLQLAQTIDKAGFDFFFLSDGQGVRTSYNTLEDLSHWGRVIQLEPFTLMSALCTHTTNLGFVVTASTSYNEPYNLARKMASLDSISKGRIAWNIVTSVTDAEAKNFNRENHYDHTTRYERADEFLSVTTGLWRSWDQDAFICDKNNGHFFDPEKAHILNHNGKYFQVQGPLNVGPTPQIQPVLVQAGSSKTGIEFAGKWAEIVFTAQPNLELATEFNHKISVALTQQGRTRDSIKIMPGLMYIIGKTEEEARAKLASLQQLVDPQTSLSMLKGQLGDIDISNLDLDSPIHELPITNGSQSRQDLMLNLARKKRLTLRQIMDEICVSRGHLLLVGTAQSIADTMETWFRQGIVDGFNIMPAYLPDNLNEFIHEVLPLLIKKNLFTKNKSDQTLRHRLFN